MHADGTQAPRFSSDGLNENTPNGIRILREPDEMDYALCSQMEDMPYATTCRVIDKLAPSHTKTKDAARVAEVERAQRAFLLPAAE
ncbi:hypothetical protein [Thioclava sp. F36-7]|nr:hypothetical protein [Thioclava sp. F36-7]OOY07102.1 hypothetical protein BMI89_19490 [Thioclava sp. F36-7]